MWKRLVIDGFMFKRNEINEKNLLQVANLKLNKFPLFN